MNEFLMHIFACNKEKQFIPNCCAYSKGALLNLPHSSNAQNPVNSETPKNRFADIQSAHSITKSSFTPVFMLFFDDK